MNQDVHLEELDTLVNEFNHIVEDVDEEISYNGSFNIQQNFIQKDVIQQHYQYQNEENDLQYDINGNLINQYCSNTFMYDDEKQEIFQNKTQKYQINKENVDPISNLVTPLKKKIQYASTNHSSASLNRSLQELTGSIPRVHFKYESVIQFTPQNNALKTSAQKSITKLR